MHCRVKPGKSAAGNNYSSRLHAITANRNATREIEILLMAAIISVFLPFFSQAFQRGDSRVQSFQVALLLLPLLFDLAPRGLSVGCLKDTLNGLIQHGVEFGIGLLGREPFG